MQVHKSVALVFELVLGIAILAAVAYGGWFLLSLNTDTDAVEAKAQMKLLQASTAAYYSRLRFYDGVCADVGLPRGFRCHADEESFAIETNLGVGLFYCLDSTGFLGETRVSKGESTACRDY